MTADFHYCANRKAIHWLAELIAHRKGQKDMASEILNLSGNRRHSIQLPALFFCVWLCSVVRYSLFIQPLYKKILSFPTNSKKNQVLILTWSTLNHIATRANCWQNGTQKEDLYGLPRTRLPAHAVVTSVREREAKLGKEEIMDSIVLVRHLFILKKIFENPQQA